MDLGAEAAVVGDHILEEEVVVSDSGDLGIIDVERFCGGGIRRGEGCGGCEQRL